LKFEDGIEMINKWRASRVGPDLVKEHTLKAMKEAGTFPITEELINVPPNFSLYIDSFMHMCYNDTVIETWANQKEGLPAP
jgi:hypothetical protein